MANRFSIRRKRQLVVGAGCVFLACLVAVSQAAVMSMSVSATGDVLAGGSSEVWTISNGDMFGTPPLNCSQEIVSVSAQDSMLITGGGSYQSAYGLQNGDIILTGTERKLSANGPSVYEESLLYEGAGAGAPEGGCGATTEDLADAAENVTPAIDPYCSLVMVGSGLMGSGLEYQSQGLISSGSPDLPDEYAFAFAGTGNGLGQIDIAEVSMTGAGGPGTLGYTNAISQHVTAFGKPFSISANVGWTSFSRTFDETPEV